MDKGIRAYARTYFAAQNALRIDAANELYKGPKGNTAFRKAVMGELMEQFSVTLASAATHYNEALIGVRKLTPDAVEGLGRPADKKGGRKKQEPPAAAAETPALTVGDAADSTLLQGAGAALQLDAPAANEAQEQLAA